MSRSLLCVDAGNTLVKWCVHPDVTKPLMVATEFSSHPTSAFRPFTDSLGELQHQLGPLLHQASHSWEAVVLSNVLGPEFERAMRALCELHEVPLHVLAVNAHANIQSDYVNPASLGKDRWAACLAVTQASNARVNLLVSFGTATTLDAVVRLGSWRHLGGFIVPGVQTMLGSLHSNTAELPQVELGVPGAGNVWPTSTQRAIGEGVGRMQVALIESLVNELETQWGETPTLWLCGGFAPAMKKLLPSANLLEHAVFKGLVLDYQLFRQGAR